MKVLFLTKYDNSGASSRLRFYQYIEYLEERGIKVSTSSLFSDEYVSCVGESKYKLIFSILKSYFHRFLFLFNMRQYDVIFIQAEIFPKLPALFEWLMSFINVKYIVDYDDAIFHNYDTSRNKSIISRLFLKNKIDKVMLYSKLVVVGNDYLGERARKNNKNVLVIPTVVDYKRYIKKSNYDLNNEIVIGWMGSPSTQKYLLILKDVLLNLSNIYNLKIVLVGPNKKILDDLKGLNVHLLSWEEDLESEHINLFDIGVMPLVNDKWEKGKCGYKLIQYMACGVPVIASNVGVNSEIIHKSQSGYICDNENDWHESFIDLIENIDKRISFGNNGRCSVINNYSLQSKKDIMYSMIKSIYENDER